MLLFNIGRQEKTTAGSHLKTSYVIVQPPDRFEACPRRKEFKNILCYCSTMKLNNIYTPKQIFKNILCYCSTKAPITGTVSLPKFKNILCYCSTLLSKPPVLLLSAFKNILCYCSTCQGSARSIWYLEDLKTSYVIVQQLFRLWIIPQRYLKTSYVIVQRQECFVPRKY